MRGSRHQSLALASLLHLQEDQAGNLYWRGRKVTALREFGKLMLVVAVIGGVCEVIRTALDLGRTAGWWQ